MTQTHLQAIFAGRSVQIELENFAVYLHRDKHTNIANNIQQRKLIHVKKRKIISRKLSMVFFTFGLHAALVHHFSRPETTNFFLCIKNKIFRPSCHFEVSWIIFSVFPEPQLQDFS